MLRKHVYETHEDCCIRHCPVCDGGLSICTVCLLAEGELTTECPGIAVVDPNRRELIYSGKLDFVEGEWKEKQAA